MEIRVEYIFLLSSINWCFAFHFVMYLSKVFFMNIISEEAFLPFIISWVPSSLEVFGFGRRALYYFSSPRRRKKPFLIFRTFFRWEKKDVKLISSFFSFSLRADMIQRKCLQKREVAVWPLLWSCNGKKASSPMLMGFCAHNQDAFISN